jgi:hypothetical protein
VLSLTIFVIVKLEFSVLNNKYASKHQLTNHSNEKHTIFYI